MVRLTLAPAVEELEESEPRAPSRPLSEPWLRSTERESWRSSPSRPTQTVTGTLGMPNCWRALAAALEEAEPWDSWDTMSATAMVVWYSVVCSPLSGMAPTLVTGDPRDPSMRRAWVGSASVDSESDPAGEPVSDSKPES